MYSRCCLWKAQIVRGTIVSERTNNRAGVFSDQPNFVKDNLDIHSLSSIMSYHGTPVYQYVDKGTLLQYFPNRIYRSI
jgi:hypothetical protein